MKYLIVQDWSNTSGNHAGMKHMCDLLVAKYPEKYEVYVKTSPHRWMLYKGKGLLNRIKNILIKIKRHLYSKYVYPREYLELCAPLFKKLKDGDEVYFLEYLLPWVSQYELACYIRKKFPKIKLYALSHLTCKYYEELIAKDSNIIKKWAKPIDKMLTLGSSLSDFFAKEGISKEKISTGFHYVDLNYYSKQTDLKLNYPLSIISMGALQRDFSMLAEIVNRCPQVHWIICHGRTDISTVLQNQQNVELKGYMVEDELRYQMDIADLSINVMEDTIGSNVITTSLAMGLGIIASDVGSIRDYCGDDNAIFCLNDVDCFVNKINELVNNRDRINDMKIASIKRAQSLSIQNIDIWFSSL